MSSAARILIVDDDPGTRFGLARLLEDEGYEVEEAADLSTAVEKLEHQRFQVAILDRNLRGEDGLVLLPKLRAQEPPTKAVLFSGGSEPIDATVDARLLKGSCPAEMLRRIAELVRR